MKIKDLKPGDIIRYKTNEKYSNENPMVIIAVKWKYDPNLIFADVFYKNFIFEEFIGLDLIDCEWIKLNED